VVAEAELGLGFARAVASVDESEQGVVRMARVHAGRAGEGPVRRWSRRRRHQGSESKPGVRTRGAQHQVGENHRRGMVRWTVWMGGDEERMFGFVKCHEGEEPEEYYFVKFWE
jgi:hypothetical protein